MAPPVDDLTRLLTELAARLSQQQADGGHGGAASTVTANSLSASISSLAGALNPSSDRAGAASSGTRVLDTALSFMCFDPLEVGRARVDWLVRTLVSALSASVSCRVVRPDGGTIDEMLCVGSSISPGYCRELVQLCGALLGKLENCDGGSHSYDLLYAVAKSTVLSPRYQCLFPLPYYREEEESVYNMETIFAELTNHPSYQVLPSDHLIPLRVLIWHLNPLIFKHDLSAMLEETTRRPLLCLRKEMHCRMEWRIIIICLVCSPSMFIKMRSLFHLWFLKTGLGSVLELHSAAVSSVLDILLKPMSWGISLELGQTFPFSHAYFPSQQSDLLAILTEPLSCRGFMDLVRFINALVHLDKTRTSPSLHKNMQVQPSEGLLKHNSAWSMMMNFPGWFSFATTLLFYRKGSQDYLSETISREVIAESISDVSLAQSAAFFLAWVICPSNDDHCQMLAGNILELSHSWARNNKIRPSYNTNVVNHRRKLRIPTAGDSEKLKVAINPVSSLIKEFDESCVKFSHATAVSLGQADGISDFCPSCQSLSYMWIPLGVLLVSSGCINEQSCDMLLHYTSTGQALEANAVQRKTTDHVSNDGFSVSDRAMAEGWALSGACLIFGWLNIVEDMLSVIFDSEDACHHFVSQLRTKTGPYLLRCVVLLLKELDEGNQDTDFAIDLHDRLLCWSKNGQSCKELEDVILQLKEKINLPL